LNKTRTPHHVHSALSKAETTMRKVKQHDDKIASKITGTMTV